MTDIWFTSDTHFGHDNIIKHCKRPFETVEEMDAKLIENWNSVVKPNDIVYHLGDFALKNHQYYANKLNGVVTTLTGNHDSNRTPFLLLKSNHIVPILEHEFNGTKVVMCHYALKTWNKKRYGAINLYGHSHGNLPADNVSVDVGVDYPNWNYTPVNLETILAHLKTLPSPAVADYHNNIGE